MSKSHEQKLLTNKHIATHANLVLLFKQGILICKYIALEFLL